MESRRKSHLSRTWESIVSRSHFGLFLFATWFAPLIGFSQQAQPLPMSDFVLFSGAGGPGTSPAVSPGYAVQLGSTSNIHGGSIGSLKLVKSTGNLIISGNVFSQGKIELANGNTVTGNIAASNSPTVTGTILSVGSNANLGLSTSNTINVNGAVVVSGGTVKSKVTSTSYSGPTPAGGKVTGVPSLPTYPALPTITTFPAYASTPDITKTAIITKGSHGSIKLPGNQTLTFRGTGVYVINQIDNKNSNTFVFDFQGDPTGTFLIYVHNNVRLEKLNVNLTGGGNAARIFTEVHGTGLGTAKYAFDIANGSPGGTRSRWEGTVWAPYAAINVGSGTGSSDITGALWSGTQVNVQSGVNIYHAAFTGCTPPVVSVVDAVVCSAQPGGVTSIVNLNDYVTITGDGTASFSVNGSPIATPNSYLATNGDIITVTVVNAAQCTTTATFKITVNDQQSFGICAPLQGKTNDLIGSELTSLNKIFNAGGHPTTSEVFLIKDDSVLIEIIYFANKLNEALAILPGLGLSDDYFVNDDGSFIITGFFPIANLPLLNAEYTTFNYVRPAFPGIGNSGTVTTQGDTSLRSNLVRLGYEIGGAGVKIGVLSDSYNTLGADDVGSGDLPGLTNPRGYTTAVQVVKEYPYGTRSDEGRAMLQIIHDVAPEAELAFRTGFISASDFAKGIKELEQVGCDIIVDDITYVTEPFFGDGKVSEAVDFVTSQGVSYFTAAGNFGNRSHEATFNPITINGLVAHNFGGGATGQTITVRPGDTGPITYTIVLQWEDPVYSTGSVGTQNDLDIYLSGDQGITRFGFNRNNLGGDPIEVLTFTIREQTTTDIMIVRAVGTGAVNFKYIVFRGDKIVFDDPNNGGVGFTTIVGQANSEGAMTVGAVLYSNTPAYGYSRPDPGTNPAFAVASFSSIGDPLTNGGTRQKPDFIAPNGVNTTVEFAAADLDLPGHPSGDGNPNFFGTSAAAPHAAAVAALLMEARSTFEPGLSPYQPDEIRQVLKSTARDMYEDNQFDYKSGAGFIRADVALMTIAAPNPAILEPLIVPGGIDPGDEPFTVIINGTNLNSNTVVYLRDEQLETEFNEETGQLEAEVPEFEGNPPLVVSNGSISSSGLDGGTDTTYFFGVKTKIVIKAENKSKLFGEELPQYTAQVLVNVGGTLVADSLSLEDVGLTNNPVGYTDSTGRQIVPVHFECPATSLSPVRPTGYIIIPSHSQTHYTFEELIDYDTVNYQTGVLIVDKMPLLITPDDTTFVYGEKFDDLISFTYALGGDNYDSSNLDPSTRQAILNTIAAEHEAQIYDDAIAFVDSRHLVNASRQMVNSDLANLAFMSSSRAMVNSRQMVNVSRQMVNTVTNVIDFDKQSIFNYRDALENDVPFVDTLYNPVVNSRQMVNSSRAMVNSRQMVNGTAFVNASRQMVNASRQMVNSNSSSALVNGSTVGEGDEPSNADVLVIVDSLDFYSDPVINDDGEEVYVIPLLFSVNMVTGVTAGTHSIVPGAYLSGNFDISYGRGTLTITKATLTVTAEDKEMTYGENQPAYSSIVDGFVYDESIASVIDTITYQLKDAQGNLHNSTGSIDVGVYEIIPTATLIETELQPGLPVNYVVEYVNGELNVGCPNPPVIQSFKTGVGSGSSSPVVSKPAGTVSGDLLVVGLMYEKGTGTTPSAPTGWTEIKVVNQANNVGMATYYKVANGSEPTSFTFGLTKSPKWSIGITRIEGADPNNPINAKSWASGTSGNVPTAPSITTTMCNTLVMTFFSNKKDATWTPPPGTTELYDAPNNQNGLTSNMMAHYLMPDKGITGSKSAIPSIGDSWVAQQIAINPGVGRSGSSSGRTGTPIAANSTFEEVQLSEDPESTVHAYPNPVRNQVTVQMNELTEKPSNSDINIIDRVGRTYPVNSSWDVQNKALGLDFTPMGTGIYFIRVKTKTGFKTVRVVKESE